VWAINGATSVLGSVLAMLIALASGFRSVVLAGAACYTVALALGLALRASEPGEVAEETAQRRAAE
jgi:hypothetical protein